MTFKIMATITALFLTAGANLGCSAVPSWSQARGTYGASGDVDPGRVPYATTSPTVEVPGERIVGADPDVNVRFDLNRNASFHLHGGGNN
jgi:hypothetical protein